MHCGNCNGNLRRTTVGNYCTPSFPIFACDICHNNVTGTRTKVYACTQCDDEGWGVCRTCYHQGKGRKRKRRRKRNKNGKQDIDIKLVDEKKNDDNSSDGVYPYRARRSLDGYYYEWKDVNVNINGRQILNNISGKVGSGQLLCILGGSGAGKSTLLNTISGRLLNTKPSLMQHCKNYYSNSNNDEKGIKVSGSVGFKRSQKELGYSDSIKYMSAYVRQSDIMCPTATGREALMFSSKLRSQKSADDQLQMVEKILSSLKLDDCQNTRIGNDALRGMSGGEKKRTAVGEQLVTNPDLIFLDEPTSGLDSFTALKTLKILKHLTHVQKKQVIATIHQPSSDILKMIDILVLLAKGHIVYYGPTEKVVRYFDKLGYECPQYTNVAEFVVNTVQEHSEFFIEQWKKHEHKYIDLNFENYDKLIPEQPYNAPFGTQFRELLKREYQTILRDPRPSRIRMVQTLAFALFVGCLYYNLPYDQEGQQNRFGAVFYLCVNSSLTGLVSTTTVFPEQRVLFERERNANMYHTTMYLAAKFLIGLPESAIFTMIYQLICYWMVGFDSSFMELYLSLFLCSLSTTSVGLLVGCFANNTAEAVQFVSIIPFILFTNFVVSLNQIPVWLRWLQWIDPYMYLVDAMCITEFTDELKPALPDGFIYDGNAFLERIDAGHEGVPGIYGINSWMDSVYFDWYMLVVLSFAFRFITWAVLVNRNGF